MAPKMMSMLVVLGLLLATAQGSRLWEDENDLSSWGIVINGDTSEKVLRDSGDFVQESTQEIAGRSFRKGTLSGRSVVLVNTGDHSANTVSAVQILVSEFRVRAVFYFGLSGAVAYSANIGDVVVPKSLSFTGLWKWQSVDEDARGELVFGNYNVGGNQENRLGSVQFQNATVYADQASPVSTFYLETPKEYLRVARRAKDALSNLSIQIGRKAATSDIYIQNKAYATFLRTQFGFAVADQQSANVALISQSNKKPFAVFLGISNSPIQGIFPDSQDKLTAATNAYVTFKTFLGLLPEPRLIEL